MISAHALLPRNQKTEQHPFACGVLEHNAANTWQAAFRRRHYTNPCPDHHRSAPPASFAQPARSKTQQSQPDLSDKQVEKRERISPRWAQRKAQHLFPRTESVCVCVFFSRDVLHQGPFHRTLPRSPSPSSSARSGPSWSLLLYSARFSRRPSSYPNFCICPAGPWRGYFGQAHAFGSYIFRRGRRRRRSLSRRRGPAKLVRLVMARRPASRRSPARIMTI